MLVFAVGSIDSSIGGGCRDGGRWVERAVETQPVDRFPVAVLW